MAAVFLTAEWRQLAMLNYAVDPALLSALVPRGTELDSFAGKTYVSLVGFRFLKTRVKGFAIPFHQDFDEINLRFYVRRRAGGEVRRGVVFIREIVPKFAIAAVARLVYNENYVSRRMWHAGGDSKAEYGWSEKGVRNRLWIECEGQPRMTDDGSLEQFITEHYWGYAAQRDGGCVEYQVGHPSWRVWSGSKAGFEGDAGTVYGHEMAAALGGPPDSAFLADGSAVVVRSGERIE
ncbi:MAG: DUF2071 domain-containing protein [Bryobacteraceae bacterium]